MIQDRSSIPVMMLRPILSAPDNREEQPANIRLTCINVPSMFAARGKGELARPNGTLVSDVNRRSRYSRRRDGVACRGRQTAHHGCGGKAAARPGRQGRGRSQSSAARSKSLANPGGDRCKKPSGRGSIGITRQSSRSGVRRVATSTHGVECCRRQLQGKTSRTSRSASGKAGSGDVDSSRNRNESQKHHE